MKLIELKNKMRGSGRKHWMRSLFNSDFQSSPVKDNIGSLLEITLEAIAIVQKDKILEANGSFFQITGQLPGQIPDLSTLLPEASAAQPDGNIHTGRLNLSRQQHIPVHFRSTPITWNGLCCSALAIKRTDNSSISSIDNKEYPLHFTDPVTGLLNRLGFKKMALDPLQSAEQNNSRIILLALNIARFQTLRDRYGHITTNDLLCQIGERLVSTLPDSSLIARSGNNEFAIVCPAPDDPEIPVSEPSSIIQTALSDSFSCAEHHFRIETHIGYCVLPLDTADPAIGLRYAERAMVLAGKTGSGSARRFEYIMETEAIERSCLEIDLQSALEKNQFSLDFQPLFCTQTGATNGVEALIRWRHPTRGVIKPIKFIPIAEESGLILPIGEWVLREACRQANTLPDHVRVAINVSALQFVDSGFKDCISRILEETQLNPERLELELTETIFLHDEAHILRTLASIRDLGVKIVMDDFGVGYCSLSYLRTFPFDCVKIDRSFIHAMTDKPHVKSIIDSILTLGRTLSMRVVAEGVETQEQFDLLREAGCPIVQGFLTGKPVPLTLLPKAIDASVLESALAGNILCSVGNVRGV